MRFSKKVLIKQDLAFFNNDSKLMASYPRKDVVVWDLNTGKQLCSTTKGNGVYSNTFFVLENIKKVYEYNNASTYTGHQLTTKPPQVLDLGAVLDN